MTPQIEELLAETGSKFRLVTLAAMRARQINSYFGQLGDGLGVMVPPQVTSTARKPLSIAFEEIGSHKIVPIEAPASEAGELDPFGIPGELGEAFTGEAEELGVEVAEGDVSFGGAGAAPTGPEDQPFDEAAEAVIPAAPDDDGEDAAEAGGANLPEHG